MSDRQRPNDVKRLAKLYGMVESDVRLMLAIERGISHGDIKDVPRSRAVATGPGRATMTDDDLRRLRDHATSNPSHAGDAVLRLVAEVERLRAREAGRVAACGAILGRLRGRKGTSEEGRLSLSDKVALLRIAGRWRADDADAAAGA